MKRTLDILAAVLIMAVGLPAHAQQPKPQPLPAELPALQLLQTIDYELPPADRLKILDRALTMLLQPTPFRGQVLCARAETLDELERGNEALAGYEQCRQLRPNDPSVLFALGFAEAFHNKVQQGVQRIIRAIELDPDAAASINPEDLNSLQRKLAYENALGLSRRLTNALTKAGWGRENPGAFSAVAEAAILHRLEAGDKAGALELLPSITAPGPGVEMLIDRRYSLIWPEIERWAGDDLSVQRRALVDGATETYNTARTPASRFAYIHALNNTGRVEDAIDELRRWSAESGGDDDDLFYRAQSIVVLGRLLGEQGRRAEGIAILRSGLASADPKDPATLNIVPNFVGQLLLVGDYSGAAAILEQFAPKETEVEAPAALGYFVALKACAQRGLGKSEAAREGHDRVKTVYATNRNAVEIVTTCIGSVDEQAALWIATVTDEASRSGALMAMETVRHRAALRLPIRTAAEAALRAVADRADVRAAFMKFGRPVPERYKPVLVKFAGVPAEPARYHVEGPVA